MSLPLDWVTDPTIQRNFDQLKARTLDTGGKSVGIRFGLATLTYPGGSTQFTPDTTAHGLGKEPVAAFACAVHSNTFIGVSSVDDTDLVVQGRTVDGSSPGGGSAVNYYWLVIG